MKCGFTLLLLILAVSGATAQVFSEKETSKTTLFQKVSPLRALNIGDVVINEFLANNANGEQDEAGQFEDWLELFNNTNSAISLTGLYLTDKADNPVKWPFPANTTIAPQGFLIIWLDEDQSQGPLHANFKLSAAGEFLMLSNGASGVLDSLTFGQQKTDTTFGRYPNGTGNFTFMPRTFNTVNSLISNEKEPFQDASLRVFPNPVSEFLTLKSDQPLGLIQVSDASGRSVFLRETKDSQTLDLNFKNLLAGIYYLKIGERTVRSVSVRG